jgi:sugar/nucleoside kinase (ribokinase family)
MSPKPISAPSTTTAPASATASVLVVGSVALDSVETPNGRREEILGGSASYFSLAARLFCPVFLVAVVGQDFPEAHVRLLDQRGVDLRGLDKAEGRTFRWRGRYTEDMNTVETLATELNVFENFHPEVPAEYRDAEYVFLANIDPDLQQEVRTQISRPRVVVLDTMDFWITRKRESLCRALSRVDVALLNQSEIVRLTGRARLYDAAQAVLDLGPSFVVVKLGEFGATLVGRDFLFTIPAYPVRSVWDTTGAGDSFAGGFLGHLAEVQDISEFALRRAVACGVITASFAVEGFSVEGLCMADRASIRERLHTLRALSAFDAD